MMIDADRQITGEHEGERYDLVPLEMSKDVLIVEVYGPYDSGLIRIPLDQLKAASTPEEMEKAVWNRFIEGFAKAAEEAATARNVPVLITCPRCKHTWQPRVSKPVKCPICQARLGYKDDARKDHAEII